MKDYDQAKKPPISELENFTTIEVTPELLEVYEVNDDKFFLFLDMTIRLNWRDDRIMRKLGNDTLERMGPLNSLVFGDVNMEIIDHIWKPMISMLHLRKEESKQSSILNSPTLLNINYITDSSTTLVDLVTETKPTITCMMDFTWYPFDTQVSPTIILVPTHILIPDLLTCSPYLLA